MKKKTLGPTTLLYPAPVTLIGAHVDDKVNFMTAAWCGIANSTPPMISVAIRHQRYTYKGIRQHMVFSVNIPSSDLVVETDYCGIISGSKVDKSKDCGFTIFYGKLDNTPLIEECPINLECKVAHILNLGSHAFIIGKIEETHISETCLSNGMPDIDKIKPFSYIGKKVAEYRVLGEVIGETFNVGKQL